MFKHSIVSCLRNAALALTLAAASGMAAAGVIHVSLNTAGFGSAGFIDMQLSDSPGAPLETVTLSNMIGFNTDGFIDASGVTKVSGGYLFRTDTMNDLFHAVTFGGPLSFDLTFAGVVDKAGKFVSHFGVSAFDDTFNPLGHTAANGTLADFSWIAPTSAGTDGKIGVSISDPAVVTVVPEPSGLLLLGLGLAVMALAMRRLPATGAQAA